MTFTVSTESFALFVHARRAVLNKMTMREAAEAAGVPLTTVQRAEARQPLGVANYLALCSWMEINPFAFCVDDRTGRTLSPMPAFPEVSQETLGETKPAPRRRATR